MSEMADRIQNAVIDKSRASLDGGRDAFMVAPTGAGKSRMFSLLASDSVQRGHRVLVLADKQKLVKQARESMDKWSPVPVDTTIGMFGQIDQSGQAVYTTVQSAHDLREHLDHYDVAIIDEAHHAKEAKTEYSETMAALVAKNPNILFVAVTATPPEGYKGLVKRLAEADKHNITYAEAIEARLIDLPETIMPKMFHKDHRSVQEVVDRHRKAPTSAALESGIGRDVANMRPDDWAYQLVNTYEQHLADRRTLAFFDTIKEATAFMQEAGEQGHHADIVHSRRGLAANERTMDDFREGRTRLLVSIDMISEGIDLTADGILLDKRTTSADEYKQIIGRGSRSHGVERERKTLLVDTGASTLIHGDIGALARLQTVRGELERESLRPDDLLPGAGKKGFDPWVEMQLAEQDRKVWATSVDGTIVYAAPHGDRYAAFRSVDDRKGPRFEMMQIGDERKGMTSRGALGQWISDAVQRNEKALARLTGNVRGGASDLTRMIEKDWAKHRGTVERTLSMMAAPTMAPAMAAQHQQRMGLAR